MSLTAGALITAARKRSFGKTHGASISDSALLEELTFQDSQIVQEISQIAPDLLATITGTATVSLASNTAGYTLSAGIHYRDFVHVDSAAAKYTPITLIQRQFQENPNVSSPAGMLRMSGSTGVFYPIDPEGTRWTSAGSRNWFEAGSGHTFTYSYVPMPTTLTGATSTLGSPDMARETLVASLELAILLQIPPVVDQTGASGANLLIQTAMQRYQGALRNLTWQIIKFGNPGGARPSSNQARSDAEWVSDQVGR